MNFAFFILILGVKAVCGLYCYDCLSLDKYDADCAELKGSGENNVMHYFVRCADDKNACSLYIGRFQDVHMKPGIVVWRKCDYKWLNESICKNDEGPDWAGRNLGRTCKCTSDFCNWREGVDFSGVTHERHASHIKPTTSSPVKSLESSQRPTHPSLATWLCSIVVAIKSLT